MNPIPLSSPAGLVYAYACGCCHHVPIVAEKLVPFDPPGPDPDLVRYSLESATDCCVCRTCGKPNPLGTGPGWGTSYCHACYEFERLWHGFMMAWIPLAQGWKPYPCKLCHATYESNYCRATPKCINCGEDHGGTDGRCRDCNLEFLMGEVE